MFGLFAPFYESLISRKQKAGAKVAKMSSALVRVEMTG